VAGHVHIKICGIRTPQAAIAAAEAGADSIGLNFVPPSPRFVSLEEARDVMAALPDHVQAVGVFKEHTRPQIDQTLAAVQHLRWAQLHGPSRQALSEGLGLQALCALSFGPEFGAELSAWGGMARAAGARALLIDAPDSSGLGGGTGHALDWRRLRRFLDERPVDLPILLAGGLNPDNVAEAIGIVRPWGVDVSSGVESSRGVKDIARIRAFCDAVRSAC
jgi:phosphoribosylanthranilate isomerase